MVNMQKGRCFDVAHAPSCSACDQTVLTYSNGLWRHSRAPSSGMQHANLTKKTPHGRRPNRYTSWLRAFYNVNYAFYLGDVHFQVNSLKTWTT